MAGVRQFDEKRLLDQAVAVFRRKGLSGTSMLDLAEATGVQRGSLYNAYRNKEQIFLLAFERYAVSFTEAASRALAAPDARQALIAFFDVAIDNIASSGPSMGCLTTKVITEAGAVGERVQRRLRALLEELEAAVRSTLERNGMEGQLTLEPAAAAQVVITFTRGLAVMERVYRDRGQLRGAAAALVQALVSKNSQ